MAIKNMEELKTSLAEDGDLTITAEEKPIVLAGITQLESVKADETVKALNPPADDTEEAVVPTPEEVINEPAYDEEEKED